MPSVKAWVVESEKQTVTLLTSWRKSESTVSLNALDDESLEMEMIWLTATYHAQRVDLLHENPGPNISNIELFGNRMVQ